MENIFLLKIEFFIFIVSLLYICYYIWEKIYISYFKFKKIVSPKREWNINRNKKNIDSKIQTKTIDDLLKKTDKKNEGKKTKIKCLLSENDKNNLAELLKKVRLNSQKSHFEKSKSLIIEWLTIDKFNKDLNLELASIYEIENNYKNAELIYKDLSTHYENDSDIRKKLWFNLAMQNKLEKSFEVYEETFKKRRNDIEVIEMLTDISYDLKDFSKCLKYVNLFLKEKPRSVEKLFMKGLCLEKIKKASDALVLYKKILDLQPYNTDARDKIRKLQ